MGTIIFTGGGTGGHVYPGLAVYDALSPELRRKVMWVGSRSGMEERIIRSHGIPYRSVQTGKLRRYFDLENVIDAFRVVIGIVQAVVLLRQLEGEIVFSKGGFVAVPVVFAARLLKIPVVIHESDADPGLATRLTAPFARTVCVPYRETATFFSESIRQRVVVTGNPVRAAFYSAETEGVLQRLGLEESADPVILVTGGSLGARQVNDWIESIIGELCRHAVVVHQTGDKEEGRITTIRGLAPAGRYYGAATFHDEFPALLRRADIVVARAGAGTIWELSAVAVPAVLIPLSTGTSRGDQLRNAERYRESGCAEVIDDPRSTGADLLAVLLNLIHDGARRSAMAAAARRWSHGNAAATIAGMISP